MSMSDPISDMLTRIRNAQLVNKDTVSFFSSKLKKAIANVLLEEGYILAFDITDDVKPVMTIKLKYHNNHRVIEMIKRVSKPSLRHFVAKDEIPDVMGGLGIVIMSTSKGVMTGQSAKSNGLGGEVLCSVY
ncbi:SSU ribosomal protein S8p (S15Ae) [hydrothermal vent metagenome]|uniref:SSU ribosomal protein S8p (S15Ae) n=1 Tax=hydrothermal vent metagenome TaxID=652676 RepID=A0A1W1BKD1_9ZZZZ